MEKAPCFGGALATDSRGGGWAECRVEVRFLQELLTSSDTPQPQAEGDIPSRRRLGSSGSHARSGEITSPFSLPFLAPQEDV